VIVLRYIADMSEVAVAGALGCSLGTVKTHASRALVALRRTLASDEEVRP
jgi:DNA-directed RNA polymerase specialized sigma24 family protein